jgi:hypothetical protein
MRQWATLFLRPSKKMRPRPRNKTRPHASAFVSLLRGERNRSTPAVRLKGHSAKLPSGLWLTPLLRPRRERPCHRRTAEKRDELAPSQLLELLSVSHQPGSQDIELAMVSQRVRRLFHNPAVVHIPN